jgi:hypothetical protein
MRPSCDSSGVLPKNTTRMSDRLNAKPREGTVVYCDSDKAPCACFADGVAIATVASVGQRTLQIRRRGLLPALWPRSSLTLDPRGRYEAAVTSHSVISAQEALRT